MLGGSEATSEQLLLVHEGLGYDEVYPSGRGPFLLIPLITKRRKIMKQMGERTERK